MELVTRKSILKFENQKIIILHESLITPDFAKFNIDNEENDSHSLSHNFKNSNNNTQETFNNFLDKNQLKEIIKPATFKNQADQQKIVLTLVNNNNRKYELEIPAIHFKVIVSVEADNTIINPFYLPEIAERERRTLATVEISDVAQYSKSYWWKMITYQEAVSDPDQIDTWNISKSNLTLLEEELASTFIEVFDAMGLS
ncbi:13496_t:CDS:2 [Ambispora gerdemannii]|uniref:13496_t:CDS:1 n=1 Tax=Ambispora gerdemannii TaxID=144530 RepID=A0A9N9CSJ4_9GLOM|nr:13496_t:CDS:2 [Ambispora gerdemannii]